MILDPEIRYLHVPWPSIWEHREPSKRAEVRKLEWATARELAEQDVWRDRLEALKQLDLPDDALEKIGNCEWDRMLQQMDAAGAKYPPTSNDEEGWFQRQGREWHWSQSLNDRKIARIADKDLRSEAYWLLQYGDHKERIKAFVLFVSLLQVDPDSAETFVAFKFWKTLKVFNVLTEVYGEPSQP